MTTAVYKYLNDRLPSMADEVRDYISGNLKFFLKYLFHFYKDLLNENVDEMISSVEIYEAVGDHIQSSVEGLSNEVVQEICDKLTNILHKGFLFFFL